MSDTDSVRPEARYTAALLGHMSYTDQRWANTAVLRVLYGSGVLGYAVGWFMESFLYTTYIVGAATALVLILCVPNWRQRSDTTDKESWVDDATAREYFHSINAAEMMIATVTGKSQPVQH